MRAVSAAILEPIAGIVLFAAWRLSMQAQLACRDPAASSAAV